MTNANTNRKPEKIQHLTEMTWRMAGFLYGVGVDQDQQERRSISPYSEDLETA
jgi:hypothetical protein